VLLILTQSTITALYSVVGLILSSLSCTPHIYITSPLTLTHILFLYPPDLSRLLSRSALSQKKKKKKKRNSPLFFLADGRVLTMGNNHFGQLGIGTKDEHPGTPQFVKGSLEGKKVKQIATGLGHVLALTEEGEVYAWGHNEQGQLGVGTKKPELLPRKIEGELEEGEAYLFLFLFFFLFRCSSSCSSSSSSHLLLPSALKGAKVKKIACGGSHSVVILEDGGLLTFGSANHGQLGHNNTTDRSVPSIVKNLEHHLVHDVACGTDFTIVITHSG
jgi:alpha-tubulin suppressor-like RCC1 family protein